MINNLDKLSQKEIQELFNRISVHIQDIKIPLDTDIQSNKNYFSINFFGFFLPLINKIASTLKLKKNFFLIRRSNN